MTMCEMCDNGGNQEALMDKVRALVAEHGVTYVPVEDGGFVYTVGLYRLVGSELLADERSNAPLCTTHTEHRPSATDLHPFLEATVELVRHVGTASIFTRFHAKDFLDQPHPMDIAFESTDSSRLSIANIYYGRRVPALRVMMVPTTS